MSNRSLDSLLKGDLPSKHNSGSLSSFFEGTDDFDKDIDGALKDFDEDDSEGSLDALHDTIMAQPDAGEEPVVPADPEDDDVDADLDDLAAEMGVNGDITPSGEPALDPLGVEDDGEDDDEGLGMLDDDSYAIPTSVDDATPAEPLKPEDDEEADKLMAMAATPTVLDDALTAEEAATFVNEGEGDIAVAEGCMTESALSDMVSDTTTDIFMESVFAAPNKPFKMTKKARFNQLYQISLQIEARQHHDPYYAKIQKAYKIERTIKAGWEKRYGALAARRAKKYLKKIASSKSPTLKKAASRFSPSAK